MTIFNPDVTSQVLKVIPRVYNIDNTHTVELWDEDKQLTLSQTLTDRFLDNGQIEYQFELTTIEGKSYSIKITDTTTTNVIYRGKAFTTAQTPQNYLIHE